MDIAGVINWLCYISRFALPVLAARLILRCSRSVLRTRYEPETWGYFVLPDGSRLPINHWESIIGRAQASDVVIPRGTVSRSHAVLTRDANGSWTLRDLRSKGGILINGQPISGLTAGDSAGISDGDTVTFADAETKFIALSAQERGDFEKRRATPKRALRPFFAFLELTAVILLLALPLRSAAPERQGEITAAFAVFLATVWLYYFVLRLLGKSGLETECLAFFLCALGLSVSAGSSPGALTKQLILTLCGVAVFLALGWWLRDPGRVKKCRAAVLALSALLLLANLIFARSVNGARNWLAIGGLTFQPSEFVKVAYVCLGAATLDRLFTGKNMYLFIGSSALCVGALALMGDFGTALIFFVTFLVIAFMRSGNLATVAFAVTGAALAGFLALSARPHIAERFATWGHVWDTPYGAGYQQTRALSAAASGGLFGQGALRGWLHTVFAADTDMVFAVLCEELGLLTALCAAAAVIALSAIAVKNAAQSRSSFHVIAACAAVTMMLLQMSLNIFGTLDILPFTGVTFPFVSLGGSSLIACWAMLAYVKAEDTRRGAAL